jgi:hypothetical protein
MWNLIVWPVRARCWTAFNWRKESHHAPAGATWPALFVSGRAGGTRPGQIGHTGRYIMAVKVPRWNFSAVQIGNRCQFAPFSALLQPS